jgi:phenylacetate-CoA ligase
MRSFPIIRYRLGDYIKLASNSIKCNCGRNHSILEEVTGRIGQLVYGKNEIYPSLIFYYIFKNLDLHHSISLNYQIIQKEKGKLFIRIEQQLKQIELKKIDSEFVKYFGQDIQYDIQEKCILHSEKEKLKSFISHLHYEF